MQYYDPTRTINAFSAGQALKQDRDDRKVVNAFGAMMADGDLEGASKTAFRGGNIDLGAFAQDQMSVQAEQKQAADMVKIEQMYRGLMDLTQTPVEQRMARAQTLSQQLGIPVPQSPDDLSDASLSDGVRLMQTQYGFEAPEAAAAEQFTLSPGQTRFDASGNPVASVDPKAEGPMSPAGKLAADLAAGRITQAQYDTATAPRAPLVQVGPDGSAISSLADIPVGGYVPPQMIQGIDIPADHFARKTDNANGFPVEFVPIPGSETSKKADTRENSPTVGTLITAYATLNDNKAIRSRQNSAGENIGAIYSKSPLGRFQDAIGGDVGNTDNDSARGIIEGVSMNALMQMISMSDVSARAMDSDAEMRAWLGAIKDDNYEAALVKLHVLDKSFGNGMELQNAFGNGLIDQATYEYVTNRANTDPMAVEMGNRMQRYASLEQSVGADRLTPEESQELEELRQWKASQNAG